jgi:hypothetical protein
MEGFYDFHGSDEEENKAETFTEGLSFLQSEYDNNNKKEDVVVQTGKTDISSSVIGPLSGASGEDFLRLERTLAKKATIQRESEHDIFDTWDEFVTPRPLSRQPSVELLDSLHGAHSRPAIVGLPKQVPFKSLEKHNDFNSKSFELNITTNSYHTSSKK